LLLQNTPFSVIRERYPPVSLSILTRYKKFLSSATLLAGRRPSFVSVSAQQYIANMLRNGKDGLKAVQEYLRFIEIDMSLSGVRKLFKRMGFKLRRKIKANFISKKKQSSSAGMSQKTPVSDGRPVEAVGVF
jgi:transposase